MKIKNFCLTFCLAAGIVFSSGCSDVLQRGMLGQTYISTARPAIAISVNNMPLLTAGRGTANLFWTGMLGGLTIQTWLAVYGQGGLAPLAITAQAQTPQGWHWDGIMTRAFSVDQNTEIFNGVSYQACTYIVDPANDPFGKLITGVKPDGSPQLWMARYFAARYNFNDDKIILEYREPLPDGVTSLTSLPLGYGSLIGDFAARARNAFTVANPPQAPKGVNEGFIQGVQWKYMGQNFLGTASQDVNFTSPY